MSVPMRDGVPAGRGLRNDGRRASRIAPLDIIPVRTFDEKAKRYRYLTEGLRVADFLGRVYVVRRGGNLERE